MKAHTSKGKIMLNKICFNCRYMMYKIDMDNGEQIGFCSKTKETINEYGSCKYFEFE